MRIPVVLLLLLLCLHALGARAGESWLPEPDYAEIARKAQRVDPGQPYVAALPARHWECDETAELYFQSGVTSSMAQGGYILTECHAAMLAKLAELYYRPDSFGPDGMSELALRLRQGLGRLYHGIYGRRIKCRQVCGTMAVLAAISGRGAEIERAVETMALLHVPASEQEQWLTSWNRAGWVR
jgi:hypothetical protein